MEENKEYLNLDINNSKKNIKKVSSKRKISSGILKSTKSNISTEKERIPKSSNCITWDNNAINEQQNWIKKKGNLLYLSFYI